MVGGEFKVNRCEKKTTNEAHMGYRSKHMIQYSSRFVTWVEPSPAFRVIHKNGKMHAASDLMHQYLGLINLETIEYKRNTK